MFGDRDLQVCLPRAFLHSQTTPQPRGRIHTWVLYLSALVMSLIAQRHHVQPVTEAQWQASDATMVD